MVGPYANNSEHRVMNYLFVVFQTAVKTQYYDKILKVLVLKLKLKLTEKAIDG